MHHGDTEEGVLNFSAGVHLSYRDSEILKSDRGSARRAIKPSLPFRRIPSLGCCILALITSCFGIGQQRYVDSTPQQGSFAIAERSTCANLYVDANDHAGVTRAVSDLQGDIAKVTGCTAKLAHQKNELGRQVVIVGTIGKNPVIERLIRNRKINVSRISGKWESFLIQVVANPMPGVRSGLVIAGSDKRGTIYGIYDLSEEIGVSPWYWWADVRVAHQDALYVRNGAYIQGPPAVKYRGIFLNDEAPSLTGWVHEQFGNYNHKFYTKVFELILRLKGNYLWPAMWDNAFNEDDPLNPKLADEYGIVMGTSHVEPMLRADKEWNHKGYSAGQWNFEK